MNTLTNMVKASANRTNMRHFKSQPMPTSYSKPFQYALGKPCPSAMQEAFIKAILH